MYISTILGELVSCEYKGQLLDLAPAELARLTNILMDIK